MARGSTEKILLVLAAFSLSACGEGAAPHPSIAGFTITPNTAAAGDTLTVEIDAAHFELAGEHEHAGHSPENLGEASTNRGHVHVYFDSFDENPIAMKAERAFDITVPENSLPGEHDVYVRLHASDHTIIVPEVIGMSTLMVVTPILPAD